jgi:hypothetical protein
MSFSKGVYFRDGYYVLPPLKLSDRERDNPGTIKAQTGWMDVCPECGNRFRRLGERVICGRCYPAPPLVETRVGAYPTSS